MKKICRFLGANYYPYMIADIHSKAIGKQDAPCVEKDIHEMCSEMYSRLEVIRQMKESALTF